MLPRFVRCVKHRVSTWRLPADIEPVVAADYVRNVRDVVAPADPPSQGLYPRSVRLPATSTPTRSWRRWIVNAFKLYAAGGLTLKTLRRAFVGSGFTNCLRSGAPEPRQQIPAQLLLSRPPGRPTKRGESSGSARNRRDSGALR